MEEIELERSSKFEKQLFDDFFKLDEFEDYVSDNYNDFLPKDLDYIPSKNNPENYFYPESYQFKNGYPLRGSVVAERSTYRNLLPNWDGRKKILLKNNKIKTIVEGKLRLADFNIIDYLVTKLYEKLIITIPQKYNHDKWLLPIDKIEHYLSFYLTKDINVQDEINRLHSVGFFNIVLKSRDMLKMDPHFDSMLKQFHFNSPLSIGEMFTKTSNVLFNITTDVISREEEKIPDKIKIKRRLREVDNLYMLETNLYNSNHYYPKSKLFNIRIVPDGKKRCRNATYYINFNTFMGTVLLLNVYNFGIEFLPIEFYKLSQYAQYIYKFIILTTYNEKQHGSVKHGTKIHNKIHPIGITYKHIGKRLSIFNQSNFKQIIDRSLNELREQKFIYNWMKVGVDKVQIFYPNKKKTRELKNKIEKLKNKMQKQEIRYI